MTHETGAEQYVDMLQIILSGIGKGKSDAEIQQDIYNRYPHTPQHLPEVAALCSRFKPAMPQLKHGHIVINRVTPDTMPTYELTHPSRMVVFVSHADLRGLLFGHFADACTSWVSMHTMAEVLDRMINNRPNFPPVEVALFTGCNLAEMTSWQKFAQTRAQLRIICYGSIVQQTVNHLMDITVKLALWFAGDEENIAEMLLWSNKQGIASPIHGIWNYSFRHDHTALINQEDAWIYNPDGILANMNRFDQMFMTDYYRNATPQERYKFLTTERGPIEVTNHYAVKDGGPEIGVTIEGRKVPVRLDALYFFGTSTQTHNPPHQQRGDGM